MEQSIQDSAKVYTRRHKSRKIFRKIVRFMGCVVAFVTTYALILPAITMEKPTFCGVEEHTHEASCYQQYVEHQELICSVLDGLHTHGADCYQEDGRLICGQADYVVHTHAAECWNTDGELCCTLPECSQHIHDDSCYFIPEPRPHVHSDACMVDVQGDLLCTQEVGPGHKHGDACYQPTTELACSKAEDHHHGDGCYEFLLSCSRSSEPHWHSENCYAIGALICNVPENHAHGEACVERFLDCGQSVHAHDEQCGDVCQEAHEHSDACYNTRTVCSTPEGHTHDSSCHNEYLACTIPDGEVHVHSQSCYSDQKQIICTLEENHIHGNSCYVQELTCQIPESDGHEHVQDCYQWNRELGCGMEEGQPELVEPELICTEPVASVHVHGEDCFRIDQTAVDPICGEAHEHQLTCYPLICVLPEHTHSLQCYSDPEADVESRKQWEASMRSVELTGDWNLDVITIAQTQLGYTESSKNYIVEEDETVKGYTRYGDWYGVPYGDWCAMYASFCLRYAGVDTIPIHSGVRPWIEKLSEPEIDLYRTAEEYIPIAGDLVFFDWDADNLSDHVGIVYEVIDATEDQKAQLKTIEGNSSNRVQFVTYDLDAQELLGYGMLPENPDVRYGCSLEKHVHNKRDCLADEVLICDKAVHVHSLDCSIVPVNEPEEIVYYCGLEAHDHGADCYDSEGNSICQLIWHQHEDTCLIEAPAVPVYYCGLEVHDHTDGCYDETGEVICGRTVHEHLDACLTEPVAEPTYYCGQEVHIHEADCYDAEGNLICEKPEHEHAERCTWMPIMAPPKIQYYCGQEEHAHVETCYNEAGELVCEVTIHSHTDGCTIKPPEYSCGLEAHTHTDLCRDTAGGLICDLADHVHTSLCLTDLSDLDADSRANVENVIGLIDGIPSAEELILKSEELAEAGDPDAEEQWMMEVYEKIGLAYTQYIGLTEELQSRVVNRDKLMELEFVWSRMPLATYYVWLDGTNGGMMSLYGSDNKLQTLVTSQNSYQYRLPTTWKSPTKYAYTLRGWYDIYNRVYYSPGETATITRNTVFYADWEAANYNVGQFNANVVDTVSTNEFVTTRMFDYSGIFNMYSSTMHNNHVRQNSHAESWNAVAKGSKLSDGSASLGIILRDWDTNGSKQNSYPSNFNDSKNPQFNTSDTVTSGLYYSYNMYDLFFNPNAEYMGKEYLGTADHLFQYEQDPNSQFYGYYFYDSARNAASYNQSTGRFYVYDYLERTTTSKDNSKDSDFLPFNSPYVNNPQNHSPRAETSSSGQRIYTFSSTDGNSGMTGTNFWFGMSTEIRFYLPNSPGTRDASGDYGNQSIYGQDMEFRFSGDDDVYVLVDNSLVLDIGGIHDIKSGIINFSTGVVTVEGREQTDKSAIVKSLDSGEHTLTLLYMERGSSMSNCSIYFNISPRFTLALQKEDLLSNELLKGAQFQVFMDVNCTVPATLWASYEDYLNNKDKTTNTITVRGEDSSIWGLAAGNTYYIKETKPPDKQGYLIPNGLIKMELSNDGIASYTAMVIPDPNASANSLNPTPGFQVEGFRIDEENHVAYLIVNNSVEKGEITEVFVRKVWEGNNRSPVTVYLLADGTRIREIILSDENNWQHTWENLPKYQTVISPEDGSEQKAEIVYEVEEGLVSGFVGTVEPITSSTVTSASWEQASSLKAKETYMLRSNNGYLATTSSGGLAWLSEEAAKASPGAQWYVESLNGTVVTLKNEDGYYLCNKWVNYGEGGSYFYGSKDKGSVIYVNSRIREPGDYTRYMHAAIDSQGHITALYDDYNAVQFTLYRRTATESTETIEGLGFKITNRPVTNDNQTSLTVTKAWTERDGQTPFQNQSLYETANVTVKLQANGVDTGQTAKLNLKSQWKYTFTGLPKKDSSGETIDYTVVETWVNEDWKPQYGDLIVEQNGTFSIQITNVYDHRISVPVEKRWDESIHSIDQKPVIIQLYAAPGDDMEATLVDSIELTDETDWKGVLKAIPPEVEEVSYYIYEQTELFAPEYSEPARIFINGVSRRVSKVVFDPVAEDAQTSVITNRPLLELPETGGSAIIMYTAGGMLTATAALNLLYQKRTKRRRGEDEPADA